MTSEHWFRPKTHGYGATPLDWRGWAATIAFVVVSAAAALLVLSVAAGGPAPVKLVIWAVAQGLALVWFVRFCRRSTDGEWRWRWGEPR